MLDRETMHQLVTPGLPVPLRQRGATTLAESLIPPGKVFLTFVYILRYNFPTISQQTCPLELSIDTDYGQKAQR